MKCEEPPLDVRWVAILDPSGDTVQPAAGHRAVAQQAPELMNALALTTCALALAGCAGLLVTSATAVAAPPKAQAGDILPDLDQLVPEHLSVHSKVVSGRRVFRLGFASASSNVGAGPLTLHGYRDGQRSPLMTVDQLVKRTNAEPRLVHHIGFMRYVIQRDHQHWHFLGYEQYELRNVFNKRIPRRYDHKSGFCLGDRFAIQHADDLPSFNPIPMQGDTCGLKHPEAVDMYAGISVGYADRYMPHIEGQYIDVTGLPSGAYTLTYRVNGDHSILESNYANNASSVLFTLQWVRGHRHLPRLRILRSCRSTAFCHQ